MNYSPQDGMETRIDLRKLIDAIVEGFHRPLSPSRIRDWSFEERVLYDSVVTTFLNAGAARVHELHDPRPWYQIGATFRSRRRAHLFLTHRLLPRVQRWLSQGAIDRFFFLRKPPGLRLRFRSCNSASNNSSKRGSFAERIVEFCQSERQSRTITRFEWGVYDAETYQFGGEIGLDIAHEFFGADSLAIIQLLRCEQCRRLAIDSKILSLTMLNQLLAPMCLDDWERWDAWRNMRLTGRREHFDRGTRRSLGEALEANREALEQAIWDPHKIAASASRGERKALEQYFARTANIQMRLRSAMAKRELLFGFRKIFPFYVIHHWNRWGFSFNWQLMLTFFMERLLNPKR